MQAFFRRLKKPHPDDEKPGFPRFKPFKRFRSLEYRHGDGCKLSDDKLYVQHVGLIKVKLHRDLPESMLKQVVLTQRLGRWHVCFLGDDGQEPKRLKSGLAVGIDMGLIALLALSDGTLIENPRWFEAFACQTSSRSKGLCREKRKAPNPLLRVQIRSRPSARQNQTAAQRLFASADAQADPRLCADSD